ncbi:MAG: MXAN_6577-like cysteine-rich protein [Archangium sp.]
MAVLAAMTLMACPQQGVVCKPGTLPCGTGCIDPLADRRNCGACGNACLTNQDCGDDGSGAGACLCRPGTTACNGVCVVTSSDSNNCGGCGTTCGAGEVCDNGTCGATCGVGKTRCGLSCVDIATDVGNCGACDVVCAQGQQCLAGACDFGAVAACYWSGQLVGFNPETGVRGALSDVGSNPGALARAGKTVLTADGTDNRIYGALPASGGAYAQVSQATTSGSVPNQLLVELPYVYVVNAGTGSLQVLKQGVDAGVVTLTEGVAAELTLGTVAELPLGMNTFPQGLTKVGSTLWIPLYGGMGEAGADAGQELQLVNIASPEAPVLEGRVSLKNVDLLAFDGGAPVARPFSITQQGGEVFVALNNLNAATYAVEGPGLLAQVSPADGGVSIINLGENECLNPQWVTTVGDSLAVSCGGRATYDANFVLEAVTASGVVLVKNGARTAVWNGASCVGADAGCKLLLPGRMTVSGTKLLVADQNGGRVVTLEAGDGGLTELPTVDMCPVSSTSGVANVSDIIGR